VAISYAFGPEVGLTDLDDLARHSNLTDYRYLHAARADCLTRLSRTREAAVANAEAARLSQNSEEQRWFAGLAGLAS
jgi:RNA polymerase sigma-70 factor, ECF subfamily